MPRPYIKSLKNAENIQANFSIQNCQLAKTKAGKPYIKCVIGDKTGRAPGRMWSASEEIFNRLPTDGFVYLEGAAQPYQGEMQIIITRLDPVEPTAEDLRELLPATPHDIDTMFNEVTELLASMSDPGCAALRDAYLSDGPLMGMFCEAPAAQALHHACIGGLLEHTWSMMKSADALLKLYPLLNRDVVLLGLFLHDLGKVRELSWKTGFGYTEDGQLVGHIARGVLMLQQKADELAELPEDEGGFRVPTTLLRVLHHIILSHHGKPEFGALKIPATPEAIFVSQIDNLDAKMQMALTAADRDGQTQGDFSERVWALETRIFRPDPGANANANANGA